MNNSHRSALSVVLVFGLMSIATRASAHWLSIECVEVLPPAPGRGPGTSTSTFGIDLDRSMARTGAGDLPIKVEAESVALNHTVALPGGKQQLNIQWTIHRKTGHMVTRTFIIEGGKSTLHEQRSSTCKGLS